MVDWERIAKVAFDKEYLNKEPTLEWVSKMKGLRVELNSLVRA